MRELNSAQMRWFDVAANLRSRPALGYSLAIAAFVIALVLRFAINGILPGGFPYLTFFPAVLLTTFFCGIRPGIVCGALSVIAAWYWFIAPFSSFSLDLQSVVAVTFFIAIIVADIVIIGLMHGAVRGLLIEQGRTARLLEQQQSLFQELQHRTANNLTFVSALLQMHQRRSADQPEVVAALADARLRLETMSSVHRRLYDTSSAEQPIGTYLRDLLVDALGGAGRGDVVLDVGCSVDRMALDRLLTLSLVVVEIGVNAAKHATVADRPTRLTVQLHPEADGQHLLLSMRDNGPGFGPGFDPAASDRLGFRILNSFARTLGGTLAFRNDDGAVIELRFLAHA